MTTSPDQLAREIVHKSRQRGSCANDDKSKDPRLPCDCTPTREVLDQVWTARARMAQARLAGRSIVPTGKIRRVRIGDNVYRFERTFTLSDTPELDVYDREALRRQGL